MWERGYGFPRFKKSGQLRSMVVPQLNKTVVEGKRINLPKLGWIKVRLSRPIPDGFVVKQAQIIRKARGDFVVLCIQSDVELPEPTLSGYPVGMDLELQSFLVTSENYHVKVPKFFKQAYGKLKLLQRQLQFKKKGSRRWNRVKQRIAKLHAHVASKRKDWHYKLAHSLCDYAGIIFTENLNLKAMSRGRFAKDSLDASFGQFLEILAHVSKKRDLYFAKVDPSGTSQICPNCGSHTGKKPLSQRRHSCHECGYQCDRDTAAAPVVRERGLSTVGRTEKMLSEGQEIGELVYTSSRVSL